MKTRNAIIAVVIVVVVIAAAAGAFILMNPGTTPSSDQGGGGGSTDIRPSGPEGSINSVLINLAGTNDTNASALSELREEFNSSQRNISLPDALAKIAVTNNMTSMVELDCANFTATLENGSKVKALNNNTEQLDVNQTDFLVLGFRVNGTNITGIDYAKGNISFSVNWNWKPQKGLSQPVFETAPNQTLSPVDNVTFESLQAWTIGLNGSSPIALQFLNRSMVLVLMTCTNNNTSALNLKASDFWLDLGNGTWVQGEDKLNNNVPTTVEVNTTVPFLIGFRGTADAMPTSVAYWPGKASDGMMIPIQLTQPSTEGPFVVLKKIWEQNATGNQTNTTPVMVQLWVIGEGANATDLTGITGWTLRNGTLTGTVVRDEGNNITGKGKLVTVRFDIAAGDDLTLLSYESGGMTKYVWLRPLTSPA